MAIKLKISIRNKAENKIKEILELEINAKLAEINETVVPLTPVGKSKKGYTGGRLKKSWLLIPAKLKGRKIVGYIYNSVHYAGHVNYGHRTRLGTSKIRHRAKSKAFAKYYVEGQYFVEKALKIVGLRQRLVKKKTFNNTRRIK